MSNMDIIQSLGFSFPMFAALVCCVMLLMYYRRSDEEPSRRRLITLMIATYCVAILCWLGIVLYVVDYDGFVWINTLFFLALMLDQVLLYHFMFIITGTGDRRKFNRLHYIIPVILTLIMGVWSLCVPYEVQYYIVESRGEVHPGYPLYSYFFSATIPIFIIYNIIYPLFALRRIRIYRREVVNYSADEGRTSAGWLYGLVFLIWLTIPIASSVLFIHKRVFLDSAMTVAGAFLPIFQYIVICYNLIAGNYIIIRPPQPKEAQQEETKSSVVDKARFESFMCKKKPYLNPKLKITDMCTRLGTNRTYLSAFVNREYGMNFSRYINRQRLAELDRLRSKPSNGSLSNLELVLMAGFSSYKSYLRVKTGEDELGTIRIFE